jgi:hypothetical protein
MNRLFVIVFSFVLIALWVPQVFAASAPCEQDEQSQFDFWLGKWTAYSIDGEKQGTNHLQKVMGSCAMQENWVSASGQFRGTSFNFYSPVRKTWNQIWIDNSGGQLSLEGKFEDGQMRLKGNRKSRDGKKLIDRINWTPLEDGRVRQHWQTSEDKGRNWSVVFDGYYQKDTRPE